ncbi:MAG: hypothetical protein WAT71_16290 [Ignavibacteria bacterium]
MKFLDKETNEYFTDLYLFFSLVEAKELTIALEKLLKNPNQSIVLMKGEDVYGKFTKEITFKIKNS